jgi:hypothetical protein
MNKGKKRASVTTVAYGLGLMVVFFQLPEKVFQEGHGVRVERVIDPPPVPSVIEDTGVLEGLEMKGQERLLRRQEICEIADALLAFHDTFDDLQAGLVPERTEPAGRFLQGSNASGKEVFAAADDIGTIYQLFLICQFH